MAKPTRYRGHALPAQVVRERQLKYSSGAAGVHADQTTHRAAAAGRTNRVGSRSARRARVVADQMD